MRESACAPRGNAARLTLSVPKHLLPSHLARFFRADSVQPLNDLLIPDRVRLALQADGWLVRSVVVWRKPSCMPDSITGWQWRRCRRKVKGFWGKDNPHPSKRGGGGMNSGVENSGGFKTAAEWEDCPGCKRCAKTGGLVLRRGSWRPTSSWEPVIMLAKTADYFADGEPVKTPPKMATVERDRYSRVLDDADEQFAVAHDHETACADGAKLRDVWQEELAGLTKEQLISLITESADYGDCWTIPFEPLKEKHYAAYPSELVRRCLAIGVSEEGYCDRCGKPFVRVVEAERGDAEASARPKQTAGMNSRASTLSLSGNGSKEWAERGAKTRTVGWRASCKCENAKPRPGRVLDPFCGSGRTGIAAARMGCDFVGVELNEDFAAMGRRLIVGDAPLFNDLAGDAA